MGILRGKATMACPFFLGRRWLLRKSNKSKRPSQGVRRVDCGGHNVARSPKKGILRALFVSWNHSGLEADGESPRSLSDTGLSPFCGFLSS